MFSDLLSSALLQATDPCLFFGLVVSLMATLSFPCFDLISHNQRSHVIDDDCNNSTCYPRGKDPGRSSGGYMYLSRLTISDQDTLLHVWTCTRERCLCAMYKYHTHSHTLGRSSSYKAIRGISHAEGKNFLLVLKEAWFQQEPTLEPPWFIHTCIAAFTDYNCQTMRGWRPLSPMWPS